jgi:hypothetical protein
MCCPPRSIACAGRSGRIRGDRRLETWRRPTVGFLLTSLWSARRGRYAAGPSQAASAMPAGGTDSVPLGERRHYYWRFLKGWEDLAEGCMLDLPNVSQHRNSGLAAIYRYFCEHLKAGAGYNFTDFSDDLTDLSYDHRGVFVNIIGA